MKELRWDAIERGSDESKLLISSLVEKTGFKFRPELTNFFSCQLSFYPDYRLYRLEQRNKDEVKKVYFLFGIQGAKVKDIVPLTGTSSNIHEMNAHVGLRLNSQNVLSYIRFFGYFVQVPSGDGKLFPFIFVTNVKLVDFIDEIEGADRVFKAIASRFAISESGEVAIQVNEGGVPGAKEFYFFIPVIFQGSLFFAQMRINSGGMPEMLADEQILDEVSTHPFQSEGDLALTDEIFVDSLIRTQQGLWRRLAPLRATLRNTRGLKKVQVGIGIAVGLVFTLIIMLVGAFVQWWPLIEILADELHPGLARSALDLIVPGSVSVDAFHLYGIYIAGIGIFLTNIIVYLMALVAIKNAAISRTLERMAYVASRGSFISQMRNFLVGVIAITFSYASLTLHWASLSDSGFFVDREIVWEFSRFDVVRFYLRSFFETLTLGISEQFGHLTFFGLSALESNKENILFSILILSYKFLVGLGLVPVVLFLLGSVRRGRASAREILNSAQYTSSRQGGNLLTTRSVLDGIVKRFAE